MKYKKASASLSAPALLLVIVVICIFGTSAVPSSGSETIPLSEPVEQRAVTTDGVQSENYKIIVDVSEQSVSVCVSAGKEYDKLGAEYLQPVKQMRTEMDLPPSDEIVGSYSAEGAVVQWHLFKKIGCWVQYAYYIEDGLMFHSVPFLNRNFNPSEAAKKKFSGRQSICLSVEDAKWIWENCPNGTTVVIQE